MRKSDRRGFTLMEFIVVLTILGASLTLVIPRIRVQIYRVRNQEAVQILMAIFGAQLDYRNDNGSWTNQLNNLDLQFPTAPKNFSAPTIVNGSRIRCSGAGGPPGSPEILGRMAANYGSYTLHIDTTGTIRCTPCNGSSCLKMGFPQF
jgi:prepilin-type N-terminal cleavage/methylation domain-containing protein